MDASHKSTIKITKHASFWTSHCPMAQQPFLSVRQSIVPDYKLLALFYFYHFLYFHNETCSSMLICKSKRLKHLNANQDEYKAL